MQAIPSASLKGFDKYTSEISAVLFDSRLQSSDARLTAALDGGPSAKLRELVRPRLLRESGSFFTGAKISNALLKGVPQIKGALDPACGAGDLLIAVARTLPIESTLEKTMENWAPVLAGCDIHEEFVSAARLRICLLALQRGAAPPRSKIDLCNSLPNIIHANGLQYEPAKKANLVVMNPPYTRVMAPDDYAWGDGLVSSAAIFVSRWLELLPKGGRLIAILPDVLRVGSNYRLWREAVLKRCKVERVRILGRFDDFTDVDVFRADFVVEDGPTQDGNGIWWETKRRITVGNRFAVSVGSVVPHRDRKTGGRRAYLNVKAAPQWGTCKRLSTTIRTNRKLFKPPFVVVRRTSSPNDAVRAIGTMVLGTRPVAVENHLLVLTPVNSTREECRKLMKVLKAPKTTAWLNRRIRCRHLTVGAVRDIPWWSD